MAETQPNKGNEGAGKERVAEIKQINIEAAKVEATLRGVAEAFKGMKKETLDNVAASTTLTGIASGLAKSYQANTKFAKDMAGLTTNQLASSKERAAFEGKVLGIQNEQAAVASQILLIEEEQKALNIAKEVAAKNQLVALNEQENALEAVGRAKNKFDALDKASNIALEEANNLLKDQQNNINRANGLAAKAAGELANARAKGADFTLEELENLTATVQMHAQSAELATEKAAAQADKVKSLEEEAQLNKNNLSQAELAFKAAGEESDVQLEIVKNIDAQIAGASALVGLHNEAKDAIDEQVTSAEALQAEMKKIDEAGGSFLRGVEDISKVMGGIPILGDAVGAIFGQLTSANKAYTDAVAKGISKTKARYKVLAGSIQAIAVASLTAFIKLAVDGIFKMSDATAAVQKGLGATSMSAASQMGAVSAAASKLKIPIGEAAALIGEMNNGLGMSLVQTRENVLSFGKLTKKFGVAAGDASKLQIISAKTGNNYKDFVDSIAVGTERFNANNKVAISSKVIYEGIANASDSVLANIGKNKNALIQAATQARMLGLEMDDIASAAESTLDFESSLAKEMEAELMLGKELNLDKLRAAAANGDVASQAAEINRLVSENKDSIGDNVLAQDAFAKSIGLTRDQYIKARDSGDALKTMTAESGETAAKNAANAKKTDAELQAGIDKSISKMTGLSDAMAKFKENMALGAGSFAMDILNGFKKDGFIDGMKNLFTKVWTGIKEGFTNIFDDKAISGSTMGKLLGSLAIAAGGATIAIKAASGIKNMLFGKKGSSSLNPLHTTGGKGSGLGDIMKMSTRSPKWMKGFKGLSKVFGGKSTIVGKQLRNVAAMMGKNQSFAGQVFKNLGSKSNMLSKVFGGITKTGGGLTKVFTGVGPKIAASLGGVGKFVGPALKGIGGKLLAPLELVMGAVTGASQVAGKTSEEKKTAGIREDMGATEGGILGALTGNANKGSMLSSMVGIEKGSAGDEAMGIAAAGARGAGVGAAIGSIIPGIGTAVGAAVGGLIGTAAEGFKVFSDPNSKLRQGVAEFGQKIADGAKGAWEKAKQVGTAVAESITGFASTAWEGTKETLGKVGGFMFDRLKDTGKGLAAVGGFFKDKLTEGAAAAVNGVKAIASSIGDKISAGGEYLTAGLDAVTGGLASKAKSFFKKGWSWLSGSGDDKSKSAGKSKETTAAEKELVRLKKAAEKMKQFTMTDKQAQMLAKSGQTSAMIMQKSIALGADNQIKEFKSTLDSVDREGEQIRESKKQTVVLQQTVNKLSKELKLLNTVTLHKINNPDKPIIKLSGFEMGKYLNQA
tara:strand:- start:15154 stop:19083 length:3930 start_codon:yes stop_codon:yes gene_type:complete